MDNQIYLQRRENLKKLIPEKQFQAYLVLHPANRFYLSGFELHDPQCNESAGCLIIQKKGPDFLCTDSRYFEQAKLFWPEEDIFVYKKNRSLEIQEFLKKQGLKKLGFESRIISHELFDTLQQEFELLPFKQGLVEKLRLIKDHYEIDCLRDSCSLNHWIFSQIQDYLPLNYTEISLAWEIEKLFRDNGASELAFQSIVGSGPNAALPHYLPGYDQIRENDLVLIDIGGRKNNYCSDQTRTFWVGQEPSQDFQDTLARVQEAQKLAIDSIRPGQKINDLYFLANDYFARYGLDKYFTHALGHGVGLETHEWPSINSTNEQELKPGMIITIEPGLYYPNWGGIRWENMILVTETGGEIL